MEKYFAASNSASGFVGWFDRIFDPRTLDRVYIIKGGSGTGKSTLMKTAAKRALELGGQCEYYYCSSDPDSVDGIKLRLTDGSTVAMLDGTAPHTTDPKYPGAVDEIVNLGEYWCEDILKAHRREIVALNDKKSRFYKEGYRALSFAGTLYTSQLNEAKGYLLEGKLYAAVMRLLTARMKERRAKSDVRYERTLGLSAICSEGEVYFDSFSDVEAVYTVNDLGGTTPFLFEAIIAAAKELGLPYDRAPVPLVPEFTEAVRFPTLSMSVVTRSERKELRPINMARFVNREGFASSDKTRRRMIKKTVHELILSGVDSFKQAARIHGEIESIYIHAMDFTRLNEATERLIARMGLK